MKFSENSSAASVNGVAALAILRMLMETMLQKKLITRDEIDIILNCAAVEIDIDNNTDVGGRVAEAKLLINGFMQESDDTTIG